MKNIITTFILFISVLSFGQKPLYEKVMTWQSVHQPVPIRAFNKVELREDVFDAKSPVAKYTLFELNDRQIQSILRDKPEFVRLEVPTPDDVSARLLLVLEDVITPEFKAVASEEPQTPLSFTPGSHYRGIIEGEPESFAAISFYEDDVVGVFSDYKYGNRVIGKIEGKEVFISYNDADIVNPPVLECWNEYLTHISDQVAETNDEQGNPALSSAPPCKEIKIYVETDYLMYQEKGRSKTKIIQDVNGMFNAVSALYENEGIKVKVNKIFVWTKQDPYNTTNSFRAIRDFGARVKDNFDGDLGHLLSRSPNNLGGVGWIDKLCANYNPGTGQGPVAYSNIGRSYRSLPTYSWSVNVLTHEMGHNLGSYHTHSCRWNGNNTQIDDCGNVFASNNNNTPEGQRCFDKANPIIPPQGGTLMSYCHLNSVGVRFNNGFGKQPGDVIRRKVAKAVCLGGAFQAEAFPKGQVTLYFGDSIQLRSIPKSQIYSRQWYYNDEPIPGATKSTIKIGAEGRYSVEVTRDCSVFSNEINVVGKEFIASINYPVIRGDSGELSFTSKVSLPSQHKDTLILDVPVDVLSMLQQDLLHWDIELKTYIKYGRPGDFSLLKMGIFGPMDSGIDIPDYNPTLGEKPSKRSGRYLKYFNKIDPGGIWRFPLDNPNDSTKVSRKMSIEITLTIRWKAKSRASDQNIHLCHGPQSVKLDPQLNGDTYLWNTGETTPTIEVSSTGHYAVTVTKGALISSDDIEVFFKLGDIRKDTSICQGQSIDFGQLKIEESGVYTQTITDTSGCEQTVTLEVEVLPVDSTEQAVYLCFGEVFMGKKRERNDTVRQVFAAVNGCDSVVSYFITVQPEIEPQITFDTGCFNGLTSVRLMSPSGQNYSYRWPDSTEGDVFGVEGDEVLVEITSGQCKKQVQISVPHYPSVLFDLEVKNVNCHGDSSGYVLFKSLRGLAPYEYYINNELVILAEDKQNLPAGRYEIYVVDANGCTSDTSTITITQPDALRSTAQIQDTHPNKSEGRIDPGISGGIAPYQYAWNTGDTTSTIADIPAGDYSLTVTDANDCMKVFSYKVKDIVSTTTPKGFDKLMIYPNPVKNRLNVVIRLTQPKQVYLCLYNAGGHVCRTRALTKNSLYHTTWDINSLPNGIYYLQISTPSTTIIRKICITK